MNYKEIVTDVFATIDGDNRLRCADERIDRALVPNNAISKLNTDCAVRVDFNYHPLNKAVHIKNIRNINDSSIAVVGGE